MVLFRIAFLLHSTIALKLICPHNVPYFSTESCTPGLDKLSQCPHGYRCRPASNEDEPNTLFFICCDSSTMGVADYFLESELSPRAVPQIPLSMLRNVVLLDSHSGQRVLVDEFEAEVSGADRVLNDTARYDRLDWVQFERQVSPVTGQFLHFLMARRVMDQPSQIQIYYDYPNFGLDQTNLTELDQRMRRGFIEYTCRDSITEREFYRDFILVLSFRTVYPLGASRDAETSLAQLLDATQGNLGQVLSHANFGSRLGAPIGGFYFHNPLCAREDCPQYAFQLTSRGTVFNVRNQTEPSAGFKCSSSFFLPLVLIFGSLQL